MESINILKLNEHTLYAEDDRWQCRLESGNDNDNDKCVKLGLIFEAVTVAVGRDLDQDLDLDLSGGKPWVDEYSVIVEAQIVPQPEYLDEEIIMESSEEETPSREGLIRDVYCYYGGIPVNIDAIQPAKASCGVSSFVTDQEVRGQKTTSGQEIEVRHFKNREDALNFTKQFYVLAAPTVFEFIDWVLDQSLGTDGKLGWDKIRHLSKK